MIKDANVTVMVSNLDNAVKFYTEILGLKLLFLAKDNWATISAPGLTIGLHPASEHGPKPGNSESLSIGLGVEDLAKSMEELKKRGVVFSHVLDDTQVRIAFFTDPDNNPLYLSQTVK